MKRLIQGFALLLLAGILLVAVLDAWFLGWDEIEPPALPGALVEGKAEYDGLQRRWRAYLPAALPENPAMVLLLHGSRGDGALMRASTFYGFDVVAERAGFIAVYPDGFEQHWNDCRGGADYSANLLDVDDVGFLSFLIQKLAEEYGADLSRVYVAGISNGGQMAYRLAMESSDTVAGIAAVAANLPIESNLDCDPLGQAVSTLIINGTADPINPYEGGVVDIFGNTSRGMVMSSLATATYWASLAGFEDQGASSLWEESDPDDGTSVRSVSWSGPQGPSVQLLTIEGGGHTVPHPVFRLPRIIGTTSHEFDGAEIIWSFFDGGAPVAP